MSLSQGKWVHQAILASSEIHSNVQIDYMASMLTKHINFKMHSSSLVSIKIIFKIHS